MGGLGLHARVVTGFTIESTDDSKAWDDFVSSDPASTFCHQWAWRSIMTDVLGHDPLYLAAMDDAGAWRGVLPLVRVRSFLGHYLISVPFLNDGGPLGDTGVRQALAEFAVRDARETGATLVELRSRDTVTGPLTSSNRKIAVHLGLPGSATELWEKTFKAKLRSQIRRPVKEGMTARSGALELDSFYSVFARNMRDLGTPVLPRNFFEQIAEKFGESAMFATVYTRSGEPAAAACCLVWRNEIEVTWASSVRELNHFSPNMLLYSYLMEEAIRRGLTDFNFGRCTPGGSTHRFKQQWGSHDVALPWPSWTRDVTSSVPSQDRPLFRAATAAWRRLPLPVANRLGPGLARLFP